MDLICASVSSVMGLASLTYTARPSTATGNSMTSLPRLALASAFSASFIGREASQISVVPLMRAAMPVPEPPPVTWMVKPGFLLMKTSAQRWPRITSVSEPFTVMLRPSAIKATAPVISNAAVPRANFEIFLIFFPPSYSCSSMDPNCFSSVTATALTGEAGPASSGNGGNRSGSGRSPQRGEIANVGAGPGVLDVVAKNNERESRVGSLNVKTRDRVQESKLGSELRVGNRLDARGGRRGDRETGNKVSVYIGHDVGHRGRGDGVLNAGSGGRKEAGERSLGIAARDSSGESDGVRVVIVVESAVGAQSKPAAQLPYGLDLAAVHFALHATPVYPSSVLELGERQRKPDYGKSPDDRRAIVKIPLQGLRDAFGVKVVIPNELRAIERIGNLTAGEHQRLELVGSISDERAINRDRLAGVEMDVRLGRRNRILQIAGGQREP